MDSFETYFLKAAYFLKFRPRSEKEVRDKLKEKKAPDEIIEKVINTLKQKKFLDDKEFAAWWVRQRNEFRPKSKIVISLELAQKGIAKEIIQELIASTDDEQKIDEVDQAKRLIGQRIKRYKGMSPQEVRQKLSGYLGRRGYSWETIRQSIDEVLKFEYNEN